MSTTAPASGGSTTGGSTSSTTQPATTQPTSTSTSTSTTTTSTSISALTKLSELLRFANGDIDQAEKLATLLARLSPSDLNNLSSPSSSSTDSSTSTTQTNNKGQSSTSTSTNGDSAAAAAASAAGIAVAVSAPNAAATAVASQPSLLTEGSSSSTTAVPFSDVNSVPAGSVINIGQFADPRAGVSLHSKSRSGDGDATVGGTSANSARGATSKVAPQSPAQNRMSAQSDGAKLDFSGGSLRRT